MKECFPPQSVNWFENRLHYTSIFKDIYYSLAHLGALTTEYLQRCAREDQDYELDVQRMEEDEDDGMFFGVTKSTFVDEPEHVSILQKLFDAWQQFFLEHWEVMHEVHTRIMEDELEPGTNKPRKLRTTFGTNVFAELSRLFYLLQRPIILMELPGQHISLDKTKHSLWISVCATFDISSQYGEKEDKDTIVEDANAFLKNMWMLPILQYSQTQCTMLMFFLTQQLDVLPQDCIEEFEHVFQTLWYRIASLMHQSWPSSVMDDVKMRTSVSVNDQDDIYICSREYYTFCSFYLSEIMRRFYYYHLIINHPPLISLTKETMTQVSSSVQAWVEKEVVDSMPDEAFTDMYAENCNHAYNFSGDDRWFKYKWPVKVHTRSECLRQLRPHLYRRYHSEDRTSKRMCLLGVKQYNYPSQTFILKAINSYIHSKSGGGGHIHWHGRAVIFSSQIASAQYELMSNQSPQLLQVMSSFWAYDQKKVFMTDDLYLSIGVWFYFLQKRYDSHFYRHSFAFFVHEALACSFDSQVEDNSIDNNDHLIANIVKHRGLLL